MTAMRPARPNPTRAFSRGCARARRRRRRAQMLHIGDDPLTDVVGATRAGMQAVWLNRDAREWPATRWNADRAPSRRSRKLCSTNDDAAHG